MARNNTEGKPLTRRRFLRYAAYGALASGMSGGFWVGGCGTARRGEKRNMLLLSIDTLRVDHLSCYGYSRQTSPNMDRFAAHSMRFTQCYAPTPWTLPSHAAVLTGVHPFHLGMNSAQSSIPLESPSLAGSLKEAGYRTAAFVDSRPKGFLGGKRGFAKGFDRYDHAPHQDDLQWEYDMAATVEAARRWLAENAKGGLFFLFLHTKSVHGTGPRRVKGGDARGFPYDKPEPYRSRYLSEDQAKLTWEPPYEPYLRHQNRLLAEGKISAKAYPKLRIEALKSQYDAGIYYTDYHFGRLLAILDDMHLSDNTVVVLTADHGEAFLEHRFFHHIEVYNQLLHVPLIIRVPGEPAGMVIHTPVGIEDIVPTLLRSGGADMPKEMTGEVLPMDGNKKEENRRFYGYYQFGSDVFMDEFSLLEGPWKLVLQKYGGGHWQPELYDLSADPGEQKPVEDDPARKSAMHKSLLAWLSDHSRARKSTIEMDDETLQHLRSLGYTD